MSQPPCAIGASSRVRIRTPFMDARSTSSLGTQHSAARSLIAAAQQLLYDKYWQLFANPGENPFAKTFKSDRSFHLLQKHQFELIAKEFQLLDRIPVRRKPDGPATAYVRLVHELLHQAEHSGSKDDQLVEGATQYLAIFAYLGEVPENWISHTHADFPRQTAIVAKLVGRSGKLTATDLARAYFGNGNFNTMFGGSAGSS